ncbi:MAG TPA: GyrI-like domain-containing protein [Methanocella sp.]|jgi:effector-binding domain-containing protein
MSFKCEIKEMPAQPALAIRTKTRLQNLPQTIGECFGRVIGYLGQIGEQPASAPYVGYYNMDMNNLDVEIGFPVAKALPGNGEIRASQLPGGKMGTCLYTGPYTEMPVAYEALTKLLGEKGLEPAGIVYEVYYNSPAEVRPEELQTLILFPLKA